MLCRQFYKFFLKFHRKNFLLLLAGLMSDQQYCHARPTDEKYETLILDPSIAENVNEVIKNGYNGIKIDINNSIKIIYNDYSVNRNIPCIDLKQISSFVSSIFYFTDIENSKNFPNFTLDEKRQYLFQEIPIDVREYIKNSLLKSFFASILGNKIIDLNRIIQVLVNREGQFKVIEIDKNNIFYVLEGSFGPNKWTWEFVFHNDFRFQVGGVSLAISETPLLISAFPKDEQEIKKIFSKFTNKRNKNSHIITDKNIHFITLDGIFKYISNIEGLEYVVNDSISKYKLQVIDLEKANVDDIKSSMVKIFGIEMILSPDKKKVFVSFKRLMQSNVINSRNAIRNYLPPQIGRFYKDNNVYYRKMKGIQGDIPDRDSSAKAVMKMFDCVRNEVLDDLDSINKNNKTIPLKEIDNNLMSKIGLLFLCTVDIVVRGVGIGFPEWADKIEECVFEKLSEENRVMKLGIYYKKSLVYILKLNM